MLRLLVGLTFCLVSSFFPPRTSLAHEVGDSSRLPIIRPAPSFALTSQDGETVTLESLRGKILAVTFIYTSCSDTCPMLTAMMTHVQEELGEDFGTWIHFVSITVDPERDTPEVLKNYAEAHGADFGGRSFLTGTPEAVRDIVRKYGVGLLDAGGQVDHTFLTSLIDRHGMLRVQYLGVQFDLAEFRRDLLNLMGEP